MAGESCACSRTAARRCWNSRDLPDVADRGSTERRNMRGEMQADVLIVGGGTGGCAAALAVADLGFRVILTEEPRWVGGQLTSQAVPADEHRWIEEFGGTRRYMR